MTMMEGFRFFPIAPALIRLIRMLCSLKGFATIVGLLFLYHPDIMPMLVMACMQTSSTPATSVATTSTTTTSTCSLPQVCPGSNPAKTASLIVDLTSSDIQNESGVKGSCGCAGTASSQMTIYNTIQSTTESPFGFGMACPTQSQLCICDINCQCYQAFGNLNPSIFIGTNPLCNNGACYNYLNIHCTTFNDPNSGLVNIATGQKYTCAGQVDSMGNHLDFTPTNPFILGYYIGCSGCVVAQAAINQCNGGTASTFIKSNGAGFTGSILDGRWVK